VKEPLFFWRVIALVLSSLPFCLFSEASVAPTSIEVLIDDLKPAPRNGTTYEIPSTAKHLYFHIGDTLETREPIAGRVRYQLVGMDPTWLAGDDTMYFGIYFFSNSKDQIRGKIYEVSGQNPGWNDSVEHSTFTHRRETFVVPEGAASLGVAVSSAGPPTSEGVYVVKNIVVTRPVHDGTGPEILLDSQPFLTRNPNSQTGPAWNQDGIRPSMATLMNLHRADYTGRAFCIIDDDRTAHAEWRSGKDRAPKVLPGESITVEWDEIYSIGSGNGWFLPYDPPPPGRYTFRVQEVSIMGQPLNSQNSVDIVVLRPYWKNPWFWIFCIGFTMTALVFVSRYWIHANIRRHLLRTRLIEQERLRIARDLHDDLGARLALISLTSANAEKELSFPDAHARIKKISGMTRELASSLSEVVWMVNPENDHLESLISFLCRTINSLCSPSEMPCEIDALEQTNHRPVSSALRHHIQLIVKEAVNNVLKHSGAAQLKVKIQFIDPILNITISDNGKGFIQDPAKLGNGIANMKYRADAVKGTISIQSEVGKGTTVSLQVPIP